MALKRYTRMSKAEKTQYITALSGDCGVTRQHARRLMSELSRGVKVLNRKRESQAHLSRRCCYVVAAVVVGRFKLSKHEIDATAMFAVKTILYVKLLVQLDSAFGF